MTTLAYTGALVITSCWCGIGMAVPQGLFNEAHRIRKVVWCPLGHTFSWGEGEVSDLKRQLKRAEDQAFAERARADGAEASLRTTKGHVTRLRKRALDGECPLCGQHLRDVARHVRRVHPGEPVEVE